MEIDYQKMLLDAYEADAGKYFDDPERSLIFDAPISAVADAEDPWFERLKKVIGGYHLTPKEVFSFAGVEGIARSVISWSLPVAKLPRTTNRAENRIPSRSWAYTRSFADGVFERMAQRLIEKLRELGHVAVTPSYGSLKGADLPPAEPLSTNWAERHVAFVAGLGTFGISGGLITRRGIAQRLGSIVTSAPIPPTPRPYGDDPFAWCLKSARGTCGVCMSRCPVQSVGESVHLRNKEACFVHTRKIIANGTELFGWESTRYGCGLCQTGIPCETCNPTEES